jgi:5-methyltetrahydropteroyltriglutamate--homocysteine methyltransferase
MSTTKPPYRADVVGSLLRTAPIKDARAKREKNEITAAELKTVEDAEIDKIIHKQEEVGLQLATDGEFRRAWWHFDFFGLLDGVEVVGAEHGIQFQGVQTKALALHVNDRIAFPASHPMLDHFRYLKAHTKVTPKMTIPSPSVMHFRLDPKAVDKAAYPDRDAMLDDFATSNQRAIKAFYAAGCR